MNACLLEFGTFALAVVMSEEKGTVALVRELQKRFDDLAVDLSIAVLVVEIVGG